MFNVTLEMLDYCGALDDAFGIVAHDDYHYLECYLCSAFHMEANDAIDIVQYWRIPQTGIIVRYTEW